VTFIGMVVVDGGGGGGGGGLEIWRNRNKGCGYPT